MARARLLILFVVTFGLAVCAFKCALDLGIMVEVVINSEGSRIFGVISILQVSS